MSVFVRIWFVFGLILMLGGALLVRSLQIEVKPQLKQVVEDTLIDSSNMAAALLAPQFESRQFSSAALQQQIQPLLGSSMPEAHIGNHSKQNLQLVLYITDSKGRVLYHTDPTQIGKDYSRWNDVYLTLKGLYGARSTRTNPQDSNTSTMYVAAPIKINHQINGVVTLGKPYKTVDPYVLTSRDEILWRSLGVLLIGLMLSLLGALWIRHSISKVKKFALQGAPSDQAPHFFSASELNDLTQAIANMRNELQDKAYIEQYVQTFTHELKSPLTAIKASAELLDDTLPLEDQRRFAANIHEQAGKLQILSDRLLILARFEQAREPLHKENMHPQTLIKQCLNARQSILKNHLLKTEVISSTENRTILVDEFWMSQAVGNLLDNAIDFALPQSTLVIKSSFSEKCWVLELINQGTPIPDYALTHVFERYYSLPRPNHHIKKGQKSTGIGLTLVKEVIERHGGSVRLENLADGVRVTLFTPY